jgi:hypothetical protein
MPLRALGGDVDDRVGVGVGAGVGVRTGVGVASPLGDGVPLALSDGAGDSLVGSLLGRPVGWNEGTPPHPDMSVATSPAINSKVLLCLALVRGTNSS